MLLSACTPVQFMVSKLKKKVNVALSHLHLPFLLLFTHQGRAKSWLHLTQNWLCGDMIPFTDTRIWVRWISHNPWLRASLYRGTVLLWVPRLRQHGNCSGFQLALYTNIRKIQKKTLQYQLLIVAILQVTALNDRVLIWAVFLGMRQGGCGCVCVPCHHSLQAVGVCMCRRSHQALL